MIAILLITIFTSALVIVLFSSSGRAVNNGVLDTLGADLMTEKPTDYPIATFAGGCFWCIESEFRALNGVLHTQSGYIGGNTQSPTYNDITTGQTGHAEAIEITFDPDKISFEQLAEYFLTKAHDPTQINRQGVDIGTQYRSEIFYHNDEQKRISQSLIVQINEKKTYNSPIATKITAASTFWAAEDYHQQYYEKYEKTKGKVHPRVSYKKKLKKLKQ